MRHVEAATGTFIAAPFTPKGARLTTRIAGRRVSARARGLLPMSETFTTATSAKRNAPKAAIG